MRRDGSRIGKKHRVGKTKKKGKREKPRAKSKKKKQQQNHRFLVRILVVAMQTRRYERFEWSLINQNSVRIFAFFFFSREGLKKTLGDSSTHLFDRFFFQEPKIYEQCKC